MTAADAAKILDLPPDATPEQLETRFNELRAKLEDKIAKAPTPGLKAKYRESLDEITPSRPSRSRQMRRRCRSRAARRPARGCRLPAAGHRHRPIKNQHRHRQGVSFPDPAKAESRKPRAWNSPSWPSSRSPCWLAAAGGW
jgi:hypothetical protein